MFCYRITKYNPKYRNTEGAYLKSEWTSYSDIGKKFDDTILTIDQYLLVENAYITAIIVFMDCLNINILYVADLEKNKKSRNNITHFLTLFDSLKNGLLLNKEQIKIVSSMILRENLWCKLKTNNLYVHFGYDYYMYVESARECTAAVQSIEESGLFVEPYE